MILDQISDRKTIKYQAWYINQQKWTQNSFNMSTSKTSKVAVALACPQTANNIISSENSFSMYFCLMISIRKCSQYEFFFDCQTCIFFEVYGLISCQTVFFELSSYRLWPCFSLYVIYFVFWFNFDSLVKCHVFIYVIIWKSRVAGCIFNLNIWICSLMNQLNIFFIFWRFCIASNWFQMISGCIFFHFKICLYNLVK